jgi:hypothetical protein
MLYALDRDMYYLSILDHVPRGGVAGLEFQLKRRGIYIYP